MCSDDRCTALLFGSVMVVCAYAPDSAKSFEEYGKFLQELMKVMTGGWEEGARRFFVACDLNIEVEFSRSVGMVLTQTWDVSGKRCRWKSRRRSTARLYLLG